VTNLNTTEPGFVRTGVNLASPDEGAAILSVSDDFFAPAKRMLSTAEPVFIDGRFDAHGKWMDGWESRRKRVKGHDVCVIRIRAGVIHGVEIDTRYFTGNYPPYASIEGCSDPSEPDETTQWTPLVEKSRLMGDCRQFFTVDNEISWTFLRLHIYPDGGIARLRVYGEPLASHHDAAREQWVDLSSAQAGGKALKCNNIHFSDMANLLSNRPVANMGDGWETRRRREAGNDWVIIQLGRPGRIARVEVDTAFFRGNYPARCSLTGGNPEAEADMVDQSLQWQLVLPQLALGPDQQHFFEGQVLDVGDVSHVRFDIYPDGGVARLRLLGLASKLSNLT